MFLMCLRHTYTNHGLIPLSIRGRSVKDTSWTLSYQCVFATGVLLPAADASLCAGGTCGASGSATPLPGPGSLL